MPRLLTTLAFLLESILSSVERRVSMYGDENEALLVELALAEEMQMGENALTWIIISLLAALCNFGHGFPRVIIAKEAMPYRPDSDEDEKAVLQVGRRARAGLKLRTTSMGPVRSPATVFKNEEGIINEGSQRGLTPQKQVAFANDGDWVTSDSRRRRKSGSNVQVLGRTHQGRRQSHRTTKSRLRLENVKDRNEYETENVLRGRQLEPNIGSAIVQTYTATGKLDDFSVQSKRTGGLPEAGWSERGWHCLLLTTRTARQTPLGMTTVSYQRSSATAPVLRIVPESLGGFLPVETDTNRPDVPDEGQPPGHDYQTPLDMTTDSMSQPTSAIASSSDPENRMEGLEGVPNELQI
ncbi:hypothetical protein ARMSODRAFT_979931 [Armillaria solidipes]|uniref:Uncharacterized protein n=1 Tax=Armillaria solidipes TaxID=1076256 RepID=A0A2H3B1E1_9AGAR|nr:hypothetical protein ARMSODRAFT_979931 [Armillaria solidipes]